MGSSVVLLVDVCFSMVFMLFMFCVSVKVEQCQAIVDVRMETVSFPCQAIVFCS